MFILAFKSLKVSMLQVSHLSTLFFKSNSFLTAPQLKQVLELGKNLSIFVTFALYSNILTNSLNAKSDIFVVNLTLTFHCSSIYN